MINLHLPWNVAQLAVRSDKKFTSTGRCGSKVFLGLTPSSNLAMKTGNQAVSLLLPWFVRWLRAFPSGAEHDHFECCKEAANAMTQLISAKGVRGFYATLCCCFTAALLADDECHPDMITTQLRVESWVTPRHPVPLHIACQHLTRARVEVWLPELRTLAQMLKQLRAMASSLGQAEVAQWLLDVSTIVTDDILLIHMGHTRPAEQAQ